VLGCGAFAVLRNLAADVFRFAPESGDLDLKLVVNQTNVVRTMLMFI
jgi:hypothetical protein